MLESTIHSILLAFHNIALVGCAAAPFYNRNLVLERAQFGPKLHYELDKVVEDTLQGNAPYCIAFIITLFITGLGMPLNHYLFHGEFAALNSVAWWAVILKLACVFGMVVIMSVIFIRINPRLSVMFAGFSPDEAPTEQLEQQFFSLRAKRKSLCDICLNFAIGVLIYSAFIGFGG